MSIVILTLLIFVVVTGLMLTAAYFLLAMPLARRQMRSRLAVIGEGGGATSSITEGTILRQNPFDALPALQSLLSRLPFLPRLQLYIEQAGMSIPAGAMVLI